MTLNTHTHTLVQPYLLDEFEMQTRLTMKAVVTKRTDQFWNAATVAVNTLMDSDVGSPASLDMGASAIRSAVAVSELQSADVSSFLLVADIADKYAALATSTTSSQKF